MVQVHSFESISSQCSLAEGQDTEEKVAKSYHEDLIEICNIYKITYKWLSNKIKIKDIFFTNPLHNPGTIALLHISLLLFSIIITYFN